VAYSDHGQENVASGGGFKGGNGRVDERVDGRRGEDEAGGEIADNLERRVSRCR